MRLLDGATSPLADGVPCWLQAGKLDLFMVFERSDGIERQFLAPLEAPAWLPPAGRMEGTDHSTHLEVMARGEAQVEAVPADLAELAAGIDAWFDALGAAAQALGRTPDARLTIADGERLAVEDGQALGSTGGGVWCLWSADAARQSLCGAVLPGSSSDREPLPVTPKLILTTDRSSAVEGIATARFLAAAIRHDAVEAASRRVIGALATLTEAHQQARRVQLGKRWRAMEASFRASLGDFGRLLEGRFSRGPSSNQPLPAIVRAAQPIALDLLGKAPPEFSAGRDETPFDALARFATICGLRLRRVRLEGNWTDAPPGPLLAFLSRDGLEPAPVALLPSRWRGFDIDDPDEPGGRRRLTPELAARITPTAYVLHPTLPAGALHYRDVMRFGLRHARWNIVEITIWGALISVIGMAPPLAFSFMVGYVIPARDVDLLAVLVAAMVIVLLTSTTLKFASTIAALRMDGRVGTLLHGAMVDRALRLPAAALRASTPVILATQLETVEKFRRGLTAYLLSASVAMMSALAAVGLMMFYVPHSALIALACVLALTVTTAIIGWRQFHAIYEGERMDVIVLAFVYEVIRLVPTIRAFGAERLTFVQWAQNFLAFQSRLMRSARISSSASIIEAGWELPTLAIGFVLLAIDARAGLAMGAAVAFVVALGKLMAAGRELAHISIGIAKLMPMAKLARSFIDRELEPTGPMLPMPALRGQVDLADVSFGYGAGLTINAISLRIEPGQYVAIVGPSGCGKSTVLRMILGLDRPTAGTVSLDGQNMALLDSRLIRRKIGTVMQNSALFSGTIFENIRGATDISMDEALDAARQAGVDADIEAMPMGMRTRVVEGGGSLSGGQIQRLLIARALAAKPAILVLDEATSALDSRAQAHITEALATLAPTRIVTSHRFASLAQCDCIFVLDDGKLVDSGRFDELAAREGVFRELLLRQTGDWGDPRSDWRVLEATP